MGSGDLEGGGIKGRVDTGRVVLLRVVIHTVFGMAGDGRNPWNRGTLTRR